MNTRLVFEILSFYHKNVTFKAFYIYIGLFLNFRIIINKVKFSMDDDTFIFEFLIK